MASAAIDPVVGVRSHRIERIDIQRSKPAAPLMIADGALASFRISDSSLHRFRDPEPFIEMAASMASGGEHDETHSMTAAKRRRNSA
jgi:hypothetical protein